MLNAVKSELADVSSVSPSSEKKKEAVCCLPVCQLMFFIQPSVAMKRRHSVFPQQQFVWYQGYLCKTNLSKSKSENESKSASASASKSKHIIAQERPAIVWCQHVLCSVILLVLISDMYIFFINLNETKMYRQY